jgi:hypothetical protein
MILIILIIIILIVTVIHAPPTMNACPAPLKAAIMLNSLKAQPVNTATPPRTAVLKPTPFSIPRIVV